MPAMTSALVAICGTHFGETNDAASTFEKPARDRRSTSSILTAALSARADEVVIFGSASEAFSQKNINCSIAESIARFEPVAKAAKANGLRLRGSISTAFGCPYQGAVPLESVADVVRRMRDLGCDEIDIADTIGVATARQTQAVMLRAAQEFPLAQLSGHFHDTYGQALGNTLASLEMGVWQYDTSSAGLGGCPYAKGATGNVATEDLVFMLHGMGIETGIDLDKLIDAGKYISDFLQRKPNSRAATAILNKRAG